MSISLSDLLLLTPLSWKITWKSCSICKIHHLLYPSITAIITLTTIMRMEVQMHSAPLVMIVLWAWRMKVECTQLIRETWRHWHSLYGFISGLDLNMLFRRYYWHRAAPIREEE